MCVCIYTLLNDHLPNHCNRVCATPADIYIYTHFVCIYGQFEEREKAIMSAERSKIDSAERSLAESLQQVCATPADICMCMYVYIYIYILC